MRAGRFECKKVVLAMAIQTFEGIVEEGIIRLVGDIRLPDRTKVYIVVPGLEAKRVRVVSPRLAHRDQLKDFRKQVIEDTHSAGV